MTKPLTLSRSNALIATKVRLADGFFLRLRGFIGRSQIDEQEGLLFPRCQSVHMWFMGTAIDVVFVSGKLGADRSELRVTSVRERVRPWTFLPLFDAKADHAVELAPGKVAAQGLKEGDVLWFG